MTTIRTETALDRTLDAAVARLLSLQRPDGVWVGELESNATMVAEHLFMLHFLGLRDRLTDVKLGNEIAQRMRADGTWSNWWEGPADLSTTIEAYVALRLVGLETDPQTVAFIQRAGGLPKARIFTKAFMALLGQWPWQRMTPVPVELILLPPSAPFSVYDFACWARQTFVALAGVIALRPVRQAHVDLSEIGARPGESWAPARLATLPPLRRRALVDAERWIRERQEADGSWGGIQPPWVWSLLFLAALGHGREDETFRKGIDGWDGFMIDEGDRLRPEACQSPVWDTGLAVLALRAAGVPADHPQLVKAGEYLLAEEVTARGDWAVRRPELAPGGWAFEYQNDLYPDIDDAAVISLALRELGIGDAAVRRALDWVAGMQSRNGGWGAFDAENTKHWIPKIPFCDFGAVIDPPSVDVSAHALEVLAPEGGYEPEVERGLAYLLREQEDDGSWWGRWGVNHLYGTGAALPALEACGISHDHPGMRRAVAWLNEVQHESGGFGEDIRSYHRREWRGRGVPTPSQTSWALLGYVAAGEAESEEAERAAEWLYGEQRPDGDWDEQHYTGTGFPTDFMIRYHLYRLHFPIFALGRLRERLAR
jgi:squalene-hopene/tetraprenyl-beta-curcumene cyclase